jgi:hypothetical protein
MDLVLTQPINIQVVMNPGVMAPGAVHPPASATGSVVDGQPAALMEAGAAPPLLTLI